MGAPQVDPVPVRDWKDELVELHVLAANGDRSAAEAAERWMAADPEVRKAWTGVEAVCDKVRGSEQS